MRGNSALSANVDAYPELFKLLLRVAKERLSISASFDVFNTSQNPQSNQQSQDGIIAAAPTFSGDGNSRDYLKNDCAEKSELNSSNVTPELNSKADDLVHLKEMDNGRNVAAYILRRIASHSKSCLTLIDFIYRQARNAVFKIIC